MGLIPSVFSGSNHSAGTTLRTRPPLPPFDREYTPAQSAVRHRPEAQPPRKCIVAIQCQMPDPTPG